MKRGKSKDSIAQKDGLYRSIFWHNRKTCSLHLQKYPKKNRLSKCIW